MTQEIKQKMERKRGISEHSDAYGRRWCMEHAETIVSVMRAYHANDKSSDLQIRVYNQCKNCMEMRPLVTVLDDIPLQETTRRPIPLRDTGFGQVALNPTTHISSIVFLVLNIVWTL